MLNNGKGKLFVPEEKWRMSTLLKSHEMSEKYNQTSPLDSEKRVEILTAILGQAPAEGVLLNGPIMFHYGVNTKIGKNTFINFNFICQDDTEVTIGENCDIGPNVTIVTPLHPMIASERNGVMCPDGVIRKPCWALPVHIGNNVWLATGVIVCPGVTIGDNCVIGAGSVVTKDIPANTFAAGSPCKVIRTITEKDSLKYKPEILGDCSLLDE